jgi:uncharacterized protein YbgA (DUF1722 family)
MRAHAAWRARGLAALELDGYVLKSASPSCGLFRVGVHDDDGDAEPVGRGLFAEALAEAMPLLPMEEEGALARPSVRAHFVERLCAAARWRVFAKRARRAGDLAVFHAAHKYAILAHSPAHWATLGRLVTGAGRRRPPDVLEDYGAVFAAALAVRPTRARHLAVLEQLASFFERALAGAERVELTRAVAGYRRGAVALATPVALIRDHATRLGVAHLTGQVYLQRPPSELLTCPRGRRS